VPPSDAAEEDSLAFLANYMSGMFFCGGLKIFWKTVEVPSVAHNLSTSPRHPPRRRCSALGRREMALARLRHRLRSRSSSHLFFGLMREQDEAPDTRVVSEL